MRKGYLGPYQLGVIDVANSSLKHFTELFEMPDCDVEKIFYHSAFQAGIDKIVTPQLRSREENPQKSLFVTNRSLYIKEDEQNDTYNTIDNVFSSYLPENLEVNKEYIIVSGVKSFLAEMIDAMANGACLLRALSMPDPVKYEHLLPSELSIPITALLNSFQEVSASSLVTQVQIDTENVKRFREIIESNLFENYVSCQSEFDNPGANLPMILNDVEKAGREIVRRNPALIQLQKSCSNLLLFTPKLVDAVFGKLPGAVADIVSKVGIEFLENRKRLVIYNLESTLDQVTHSHFRAIKEEVRRLEEGISEGDQDQISP